MASYEPPPRYLLRKSRPSLKGRVEGEANVETSELCQRLLDRAGRKPYVDPICGDRRDRRRNRNDGARLRGHARPRAQGRRPRAARDDVSPACEDAEGAG